MLDRMIHRREAGKPHFMREKSAKFAFAALGIATNNLARHRAGKNKPGQMAYRFDDDFQEVLARLTAASADYRMLSIHYGIEGSVRADACQIKDWRQLISSSMRWRNGLIGRALVSLIGDVLRLE